MLERAIAYLQDVIPHARSNGRSSGAASARKPAEAAEEAPAPVQAAPARTAWREDYEGGSPEAERLVFERLARDIMLVQLKTRKRSGGAIARTFHAKSVLAVASATLRFDDELPGPLRVGHARPGAAYETTVRFSNASSAPQADSRPDLRGVALRVRVSESETHDLLMTNFPVSHARDARQFVAFARATAGNTADRILGLAGLVVDLGPSEVIRMVKNIQAGRNRRLHSLALETYWSRGAIRWGETLAVRYLLRPLPGSPAAAAHTDPEYLRAELARRLSEGDVVFELCVQYFKDPVSTPVEDASVEWTEAASPAVRVAQLTIPKQDVAAPASRAAERQIDELAFNPWNTTDDFRPLGNLNRARKVAYDASAAHRKGHRFAAQIPLRNRVVGALARSAFRAVNSAVEWHRLPVNLGLLNIDGFRHVLRASNLLDTEPREAPPAARPTPPQTPESVLHQRTYDGSYNDLSDPGMGAIGAAFGRNMKPVYRPETFDVPNPVEVSRALLYREQFIPARSLNLLAASWIQFQVHDWVNHDRHPLGERDVVVPMPHGQTWQSDIHGPDEPVMRFGDDRGPLVGKGPSDRPPILFGNRASHWWDGSEVYGPTEAKARALRDGACLRLDNGHLPVDLDGMEITGFNESWWLGLSAMHTLFAREHNAICDALRREYRDWDDERTYRTARLIVAALIAKIHTIEWTPAILGTKAIEISLNANWGGPPSDWLSTAGLWLIDAHALTGIPKTLPDHHAAPYSLTEEFVTVYRMHPLIPDDYTLVDYRSRQVLSTPGFLDIQGRKTDEVMRQTGLESVLYSLGIAHPGAITLHNFPRTLQALERDGRERIDLSVIDLVRARRRGIPRYNDFRAALHRPRIRRFEDLCDNPESVRRLKEVYRGDIDAVDAMVGLFAETPPRGFGFSDTAFRIFILMASRRLQSDRFFTVDFRPDVYSPLGMDWIANNGMTSILLRHLPELAPVIPRTGSAFAPWRPLAPTAADGVQTR